MNCPKCGGAAGVRGSYADCESIHRRRVCKECGYVFYTAEYEVAQPTDFYELQNTYFKTEERKKYAREYQRDYYCRSKGG
jgi:transcriptional regulator NrdR family protein